MVKKEFRNYTVKNGRTVKEMTIRPDKENGVFVYKDILEYVNKNIKNIAPHKRVTVRAVNIQGDRTLDTFNTTLKKRKDLLMIDDGQFDEYLKGEAKDITKFKHFYSFTISISEDPVDNAGFMFH